MILLECRVSQKWARGSFTYFPGRADVRFWLVSIKLLFVGTFRWSTLVLVSLAIVGSYFCLAILELIFASTSSTFFVFAVWPVRPCCSSMYCLASTLVKKSGSSFPSSVLNLQQLLTTLLLSYDKGLIEHPPVTAKTLDIDSSAQQRMDYGAKGCEIENRKILS